MTVPPALLEGGLYRVTPAGRRRADALVQRARRRGFAEFTLDLAETRSKAAFLRTAAAAMAFPDYFGGNWDAFYDCVTDLGWRPAPGYLVRVRNTGALSQRAAPVLAEAVDILAEAADFWRGEGIPFVVLVDDPGMPAFGTRLRSL
ncbi:MAG TPA: barstar family protein [Pelomicrobium sp.]|nr:barstar family protein [Pelomicrobium sp.]